MAQFNHLAPGIDRAFRFVEMIGITALLGTVLAEQDAAIYNTVVFIGTLLAITYLTEPPVEWIAGKIVGPQPTIPRALGSIAFFTMAFILAALAAPFVSRLAVLIGETIN